MTDKEDHLNCSDVRIDALTQLCDRACLPKMNEQFLERQTEWTLLMIDIDHFKLINDIYGHLAGDEALQDISGLLIRNLRSTDVGIRYGGDEFLAVLPVTTADGAVELAQRLIHETGRLRFTEGFKVSISIGVTCSRQDDSTFSSMLARADKALYRAKETGRGKYHYFRKVIGEAAPAKITFTHHVGRQKELNQLRQLEVEAITDSARVALITGETGVGKTRLVEELLKYSKLRDIRIARYKASDYMKYEPYLLVIEPMKDIISEMSSSELNTVLDSIDLVHPATADLLPETGLKVIDNDIFFREENLQYRILHDIASILSALSDIKPLLIIFDNLQWASKSDIDILSYVSRNTPDANIFYICVLRSEELGGTSMRKLLNIHDSVPLLTIRISNLSGPEASNLILFALKDPNVPHDMQEFLIEQSGGNPLILKELITHLVSSRFIARDNLGEMVYIIPEKTVIPENIGRIITSKLDDISDSVVDVLRVAALEPRHLTLELLEAATGKDQIELGRSIESAIQGGFLEERHRGASGVSLRFLHGAVSDHLAAGIPASLKATYHQRMGRFLEKQMKNDSDDLLPLVAYHYIRGLDRGKAGTYAYLAAEQARKKGANSSAINWYMEFLERYSDAEKNVDWLFRTRLYLGDILSLTGEVMKGQGYLRKALELAPPDKKAEVHFLLGRSFFRRSLYPETSECYLKALELTDDYRLRVRVLVELVFTCRLMGKYEDVHRYLEQAEKLLDENGEPQVTELRAHYYTRYADIQAITGSTSEALEFYEKALKIYHEIADKNGISRVLNNSFGLYSAMGDYDRALDSLTEALKMSQSLDDLLSLAIAHYNLAEFYTIINRLSLAREHYLQYMKMNEKVENELGKGYGNYGIATIYRLEGKSEKSELAIRKAIALFDRLKDMEMKVESEVLLIQLLIEEGRTREARDVFMSLEPGPFALLTENNRIFAGALVSLNCSNEDVASIEESVELFRKSLSDNNRVYESGIALRYTGLARAYRMLGDEDKRREVLVEGASVLTEKLKRIRNISNAKSVASNCDITKFIELCKAESIPCF